MPLPGPAAVVGARYEDSPVGPYVELSVCVPARLGLRAGLCVVSMAVDSSRARRACRASWGLPTELGALRWESAGDERALCWEERGLALRARAHGAAWPAILPLPALQWRGDGAAVLTRRVRGRARLARCQVEVASGDDLAWLAGAHRGVALAGLAVVASAARRPAGLLSSVPWPERRAGGAAEPAGGAATMAAPRAYGSVG